MNNEENDCPLSSKDWILFLNGEITNLENESRILNNIYPAMAVFAALIAIILNTFLSTANNVGISPNGKNNIFYVFSQGMVALNILFYIFLLGFLSFLIYLKLTFKRANILRKIRDNILEGSLKNTNEIHEKWKNAMKLKYIELLKFIIYGDSDKILYKS